MLPNIRWYISPTDRLFLYVSTTQRLADTDKKISRWKIRGRKRNAGLMAKKKNKKKKQKTEARVNKNNSHDRKSALLRFIRRNELCVASCPLQTTGVFSHGIAKTIAQQIQVRQEYRQSGDWGLHLRELNVQSYAFANVVNQLPVESSSPTAPWKLY